MNDTTLTDSTTFIHLCVGRKMRVTWWEPYRLTFRSGLEDLKSTGVLRITFWVRVVVVSAAMIGLVVVLKKHPGTWVPWQRIIAGLIILPTWIALGMVLFSIVPRHIDLRREWVQFTHRQRVIRVLDSDIHSISLVEREGAGLHLRLEYFTQPGKQYIREIGVSRSIDRAALETLIAHLSNEASRHRSSQDHVP